MQVYRVLVPVRVVLPEDGAGCQSVVLLYVSLFGLLEVAQLLGPFLIPPLPGNLGPYHQLLHLEVEL